MNQFSDLLTSLLSKGERMTRKELARRVGFEPPRISDLLNGKTRASDDTVNKIATALKLDDTDRQALLDAARADRERKVEDPLKFYPRLPIDKLPEWISEAQERIWIQESWIGNPIDYKDAFLEAARNKCTIRVVLLDPDGEGVKQRAEQLARSYSIRDIESNSVPEALISYVSKNASASLEGFRALQSFVRDQDIGDLEIRKSDVLPDYPLYIIDQRALIGAFVSGRQSNVSPHFEVQLNAELKLDDETMVLEDQFYVERFRLFWEAAKLIN